MAGRERELDFMASSWLLAERKTPEHRLLRAVWREMWKRCSDRKHKDYPAYGGRGLRVVESWLDFSTFLRDMGPRPKGYLIDRVDNEAGYGPDNCRWASAKLSGMNRRPVIWITFAGKKKILSDWARHYHYDVSNLHKYWKAGGLAAVRKKLRNLERVVRC